MQGCWNHFVTKMEKLLLVAALTASLLLGRAQFASAQQVRLLPEIVTVDGSSDGTPYQADSTLEAATAQQYVITTPNVSGTYFNVRIQLEQTEGHVGFYCNPQWGGQPEAGDTIASRNNAIWQTEDAWSNNLTISANDASYLPADSSSASAVLAGLSTASDYLPAFNCTAINPSSQASAAFTLTVTMDANNQTLTPAEQESVIDIYSACCQDDNACATWKSRASTAATSIWQNFCQLEGQYCTVEGNLQQLDLTFNLLNCTFPTSVLSQFSSLETVRLSSNPDLQGDFSNFMTSLSSATSLQHIELKGNTGIKGPLDADDATALCGIVQNGLQYLDFGNMELTGTIPDCLLDSPGKLSIIGLSSNNLTGSLPDTIPSNSSLFTLDASTNNLTGSIPASIVNARDLYMVNLQSNQLDGAIPEDFGTDMPLLSVVQLYGNALSGTLPTGLATSTNVAVLDVHQNNLTGLPDEWLQGFTGAADTSFQQIYLQDNQLEGEFPAALASLPALSAFFASNNNLSGTLPGDDSVFPVVRLFDVSSNILTGSIPATFSSAGPFNDSLGGASIGSGTFMKSFDLAHNNFSGDVPSFMAEGELSTRTKIVISLLGNDFVSPCGDSSFTYLDICDASLNATDEVTADSPAAAPGNAPDVTLPAESPAVASEEPASSGDGSASKSISSGGVAGAVIAGVVVVAVAAGVATWYIRRPSSASSRGFKPVFTSSNSGFAKFQEF